MEFKKIDQYTATLVTTGNGEKIIGFGCLLFSLLPWVATVTESTSEFYYKMVFTAGLIWVGLLSLGDKDNCVIDKKKNVLRVTKNSLYKKRDYVHNLDELLDCEIETAEQNTNPKYRIKFVFNDGIEIPATEIYFRDKISLEKVVQSCNEWLEN